ncbi:MAG TPA: NADH-quinone oxidoreductase subunit F [Thermoplasmatales archaeon]|nr:NADH-quinone oxidoreductase subunit F [Thermoplasmatales archaeon]
MVIHPVLLIAVPLLFAFLMPLLKRAKAVTIIILLFNTLLAILMFHNVYNNGPLYEIIAFSPPIGIYLYVDNIAALLAVMINLLAFINFLSVEKVEIKFAMLYLLAVASSTGIVITGDIFNMFVFFEIAAVSSYALVAWKRDKEALEGAIKYMVLGSIASVLMLVGIAFLYSEFRSLNIYDIMNRMDEGSVLILLSFAFLLTGIGVEAEIFPLNGWVPDAYQGAAGSIASLLSFGPSKAGIYAIARLLMIFSWQQSYDLALYVGIITLLIGELAAFRQENVKRMLAYSSIGQMGLILISLSMLDSTDYAIIAFFFLLVSHAASKGALFLLSERKGFGSNASKYAGIVSVMSLIGMPPMAGFWGKWYIIMGAMQMEAWWIIAAIVFSSVVEAAYFARYLSTTIQEEEHASIIAAYPPAIMATLTLLLGILPFIYKIATIGGVING